MNIFRSILFPACLILSACVQSSRSEAPTRAAIADTTLPPVKVFAKAQPSAPARSNRDMVRDFLDLSFTMESGRELSVFTRFEGPITVRVTGKPSANLTSDLSKLINRLRNEARVNISLTKSKSANITIEAVSRAKIKSILPQAACFVVPNIDSLSKYRSARRDPSTNWAQLRSRQKLAVFVPNDTSPQEVRDCLHEELAQALGPLNDLYRLPDSVFNDDNIHAVLTGFDMMILRAYYDPSLSNGMSRPQVARLLPSIFARINPAGERIGAQMLPATPRAWINAIQTALGPGAGQTMRRAAATDALRIAQERGWQDHRRAFSHYALGRLTQSVDADFAHTEFRRADMFYRQSIAVGPHRAYVTTLLAAYAISAGQSDEALKLITPQLSVAAKYENAALLSTLMLLHAEALELSEQTPEASLVRMDSLGWARYGFGADWAVRAKMREIASLSPLKGRF